MMSMFGFRGGLTPPQSEEPDSSTSSRPASRNPSSASTPRPNPRFSSSTSSVGPARPLRLVYCDEKGKFRMDPEAVATLQLVKGPIWVVSVCGRARQGKSFILNQLLGRSSGFQVASTHRPCTKGLWMWSAPIRRTALDGTEYSLLLLDSEGIDAYHQTGTYSMQIFSLALLLSSMFIYNQMGGIDEAALDRLSLVTEMTKHICVKSLWWKNYSIRAWAILSSICLAFEVEDNRKITPRDYLELALRPVQGGGRDISSKYEIRESIRALFPDRECFTLVQPLNNKNDLQRLDQISLDRLRPEFRSGLDELTKFVFERTKPKQVGATVMTGPILAGLTQSFLDAINNGAVPTISSSWQSVEEAECGRAYDSATEAYMSSFDRTKPAEEAVLREAHEVAVQKALAVFNSDAVGTGSARLNYEKLLHNFFKKAFEEYKRNAFLEADLQCSNTIQRMETKLRAAFHLPDAKLDNVVRVLDDLVSDYESSSYGPGKSKNLEGPILDLFQRQLDKLESERNALRLKCTSSEDKMVLLKKQLEANEKHRTDYLKHYEEVVNDKQKISEGYSARISNLQGKCSTLEARCLSLSKALDFAKQECSEWRNKSDNSCMEIKAEEDKFSAQFAALESRISAAEGRLAAAREQAKSAQEETLEWKQKFDRATDEAKTGRERAAFALEQTNRKAQEREDALRAELFSKLQEKEEEIKHLTAKADHIENHANSLISKLEAADAKLKNQELQTQALMEELENIREKLDVANSNFQSHDKEIKILEQDKKHIQEKFLSECKKFDEVDKRCKDSEREAKRAVELADIARAEAVAAQKEKSEAQHLAMERLTQ